MHYLSCSPPTLARDLKALAAYGYHLESLELFDLFPQTYHIEALARLARSG
jgi:23S rRNA (uracil1939-C5)-methyltransferase